jgi:hypothetical protein
MWVLPYVGLIPHDLRRSYVRSIDNSGVPASLGQKITPSVRFSVESGDKKKEGVSEQLCLAGQKGDTPCHLKAED